ncbi:MAG TPA: hypothetical protein VJ904_13570, partial [Tichowtungia sp.]|nr:hypothetical protein [Tichowtungia sp.]
MSRIKKILILAMLPVAVTVCADTVLLTDDFASTIDPAKWALIKVTGSTSFDESSAGNSTTHSGSYMWIQNLTLNAGGAYKSKLLPVDGRGEIIIARKVYLTQGGSTQLTMPDE